MVATVFLPVEGLEGFGDAVRQTLGWDVIIRWPIISIIPLLVFHLAVLKIIFGLRTLLFLPRKKARDIF